jgi:hypothetical protein
MFLFIRCCSSLTPGLLKPSLNPFGLLNTGACPVAFSPGFTGPVFLLLLFIGFLNTLIMTSAFNCY